MQAVHQLLPPPYRDVWLEWQTAENQKKQEKKTQENKVPAHFLFFFKVCLPLGVTESTLGRAEIKIIEFENSVDPGEVALKEPPDLNLPMTSVHGVFDMIQL